MLGANYGSCSACHMAVEKYWLADWYAFLAQEQIRTGSVDEQIAAQIIFDEVERHPWTVLDVAMTWLTCATCSSELGGGPPDCSECAAAWGHTLWAEHYAGRLGLVSRNEHALHVGRMILRHPHRQSTNTINAWRRTMPRLLTGWLPTTQTAQHYMALIKKGHFTVVDAELRDLDRALNNPVGESNLTRGA
jgi:hypothetical protein